MQVARAIDERGPAPPDPRFNTPFVLLEAAIVSFIGLSAVFFVAGGPFIRAYFAVLGLVFALGSYGLVLWSFARLVAWSVQFDRDWYPVSPRLRQVAANHAAAVVALDILTVGTTAAFAWASPWVVGVVAVFGPVAQVPWFLWLAAGRRAGRTRATMGVGPSAPIFLHREYNDRFIEASFSAVLAAIVLGLYGQALTIGFEMERGVQLAIGAVAVAAVASFAVWSTFRFLTQVALRAPSGFWWLPGAAPFGKGWVRVRVQNVMSCKKGGGEKRPFGLSRTPRLLVFGMRDGKSIALRTKALEPYRTLDKVWFTEWATLSEWPRAPDGAP